jgi:hypothetical protein
LTNSDLIGVLALDDESVRLEIVHNSFAHRSTAREIVMATLVSRVRQKKGVDGVFAVKFSQPRVVRYATHVGEGQRFRTCRGDNTSVRRLHKPHTQKQGFCAAPRLKLDRILSSDLQFEIINLEQSTSY